MSTGALFSELGVRGQRRVLRGMAAEAVSLFGLPAGRAKFIHSGENATFSYDTNSALEQVLPEPYHPSRLLIRLHGTVAKNEDWIRSEVQWLTALRASGLVVPEPLLSIRGELVEHISFEGASRPCTVMRWIEGRRCRVPSERRMYLTGRLMAQMHSQALVWKRPSSFIRRVWNWDEFFGEGTNMSAPASVLWEQLPAALVPKMQEISERTRELYPDVVPEGRPYGLVHADLHTWNTAMYRGQVYPIDFDDCGFAYHLMDFANVLSQPVERPQWPSLAKEFLKGYRELRPFPESEWRKIGIGMAARCASNALWIIDKAQTNAYYRKKQVEWVEEERVAIEATLKVDAELS